MQEYVKVIKSEDTISVCFYIEHTKPFELGEKMQEINEEAYMNGYNWEAFWNYYLEKYKSDLYQDLETDSEAGMYCAYYELTNQGEEKAIQFANLISTMVEAEEEIYRILREESDDIEWD